MIMLDMNLCYNEVCNKGTTLHFDIYEGTKFRAHVIFAGKCFITWEPDT